MRKLYALTGIILLLIYFSSCKTAVKLYEKGNYDEAVDLAVKKLQKKPGDEETRSLLQSAYRYAVNDHENRIRNLAGNSNELKWEWTYNEYTSLQRLYDAIYRSPEAFESINPTDYSEHVNTYADKAADVRYQRGLMWMEKNDKRSFRNAFSEFETALRLRPGDFTILEKKKMAYQAALINVVVMPMNNPRYRYSSYNQDNFYEFDNDMLRYLQNNTGNRFIKFYSMWDARNRNLQPDQIIDFQMTTINMGNIKDVNTVRDVSREVVIKETAYRPDSVVKEYKKVYARITTTKRTMNSAGRLRVNIRDSNGRWLWSDDFNGDHIWNTEFSTFTGDERALSESDKELVNRKKDTPPGENVITRQIINEINNKMISRVRDYFSRF